MVAELLNQSSGSVLKPGIDAVDDQEGRPHHLLRRRENVEQDGLIDGRAGEMGQHDQLARFEERLAVLIEQDLNGVFSQTLPGQPAGEGVAGHSR